MKKQEDKLHKISAQLVNIILLGFFWTLTSIPILTVGASLTALSESTRAYVVDGETKPLKVYFASFRTHFVNATAIWVIHLLAIILLVLDLLYYSQSDETFNILALSITCVILTLMAFEMQVVFTCIFIYSAYGIRQLLSKAMDLAFTCLIESIEMMFLNIATIVVSLFLLRGLLPFVFGIISWLCWQILPRMFEKYNIKKSNRDWQHET